MTVSSVTLFQVVELEFTGANFPISDPCEAVFFGKISDSCTVQSSSKVIAIFDNGLPTTSTDTVPELRFIASDGTHYALFDQAAVLQNPLDITSTTSGASSFAGG